MGQYHFFRHFKTITKHRHQVIRHCFKAGIGFQGLFHDLSKYSPSEFIVGAKYYQGNRSPNAAEREKYGANDIRPGLTGWAQINGRDELEIPVKARFDGEYVEKMGIKMDLRCFFGTFISVLRGDGVVEGGTGTIHEAENAGKNE